MIIHYIECAKIEIKNTSCEKVYKIPSLCLSLSRSFSFVFSRCQDECSICRGRFLVLASSSIWNRIQTIVKFVLFHLYVFFFFFFVFFFRSFRAACLFSFFRKRALALPSKHPNTTTLVPSMDYNTHWPPQMVGGPIFRLYTNSIRCSNTTNRFRYSRFDVLYSRLVFVPSSSGRSPHTVLSTARSLLPVRFVPHQSSAPIFIHTYIYIHISSTS